MYRVLDGDQVCVYDPSNIYLVDPSMSKEFEIGSKVVLVQDLVEYKHEYADKSGNGTVVFQSRNKNPFPEDKYYSASKVIGTVLIVPKGMTGEIKNSYVNTKDGNTYFTVKFKKGGTYQNTPKDILKPI
jgi:hypothetical protein